MTRPGRVGIYGLPMAKVQACAQALHETGLVGVVTDQPVAFLEEGGRVLVLPLLTPEGRHQLLLLRDVYPGSVLVGLLASTSATAIRQALLCGASAVIDLTMSPETVAETIGHASRGMTCLPTEVVTHLLSPSRAPVITAAERVWLVALAEGATVRSMAQDVSWSTRTMHRRLHALYIRLGVADRSRAVLWAEHHGLL